MTAKTLSNDQLWKAILSGDPTSRNQAYKQLYLDPAVRGKTNDFARMYQVSEADAEDLLQEAMIRLDRIILDQQFRGESAIATFLVAIVRNLMRDKVKGSRKEVLGEVAETLKDEDQLPAMQLTEQTDAENKRDQLLRGLLGKLKADCQQLLANYYYLGKTMAMIASEQGLKNANQAKKKAFSCRQHLRELIEAQPGLAHFLKLTL